MASSTGIVAYQNVAFELVREKTNNLGFDQVRHKQGCTATEDEP